MVESHVVSITAANHADEHRHGGDDPVTGDVRIEGTPRTMANVTASRVLNTNYQNLSGHPMHVAVLISCTVGGSASGYVKATTPADVAICGDYDSINGATFTLNFIVPINYYYRVAQTGGTMALFAWHEWT